MNAPKLLFMFRLPPPIGISLHGDFGRTLSTILDITERHDGCFMYSQDTFRTWLCEVCTCVCFVANDIHLQWLNSCVGVYIFSHDNNHSNEIVHHRRKPGEVVPRQLLLSKSAFLIYSVLAFAWAEKFFCACNGSSGSLVINVSENKETSWHLSQWKWISRTWLLIDDCFYGWHAITVRWNNFSSICSINPSSSRVWNLRISRNADVDFQTFIVTWWKNAWLCNKSKTVFLWKRVSRSVTFPTKMLH